MSDRILPLGREIGPDGTIRGPIGLNERAWRRHLMICGTTGTGKSTTGTGVVTIGNDASNGLTIVFCPKGDGWPIELARAHYKQHGTLEDVYLFEFDRGVPGLSFFDIRPQLDAGITREFAIKKCIDQFLSLLADIKRSDQTAIRSPDVIKYLARAQFDPVTGQEAFPVGDLLDAIYEMRRTGTVPDVSQAETRRLLEGLTDGTATTRDQILQGAVTRVEKISDNGVLRPMFNQVPANQGDAFRFDDFLDQDALLIFNLGPLARDSQRVVANTLLAALWWALKRRKAQSPDTATHDTVLVCIDEIAQLGVERRLQELIEVGRGLGLALIPMLQTPSQLTTSDAATEASLLSNIQSYLVGQVANDDALVDTLADSTMSEAELRNRLTELPPKRWLFKHAAIRGTGTIPLTQIAEPKLPPGHPDGDDALTAAEQEAFEAALADCRARTEQAHMRPYGSTTADDLTDDDSAHTLPPETLAALEAGGFRTTLPLVEELPAGLTYDADRQGLRCPERGRLYDPSFEGLKSAINCHGVYEAVPTEKVPPVKLGLTLTEAEREAAPVTTKQLCALQLLYNISQGDYDRAEIDRVHNQLTTVLRRLSIEPADLNPLLEEGYLTRSQLKEHVYYTVTAEGRSLINERQRKDIDWGEGKGDLTETLLHRVMVEALARYIEQEYVRSSDSPVTGVHTYYELSEDEAAAAGLDERVRLDVVGVDAEGSIVVIGEAERHNNDSRAAARADYDQMAALEPAEALWVVPSSSRGHDAVIQPLSNPPEDADDPTPRISSYSESTRIPQITGIDSPGMTGIFTLNQLRKQLADSDS